jgi:DNA-binding Lrp family transcriptional regulator
LKTEAVGLLDQYSVELSRQGVREITRQMSHANIQILSAMWKHGPRNLLEVSRRTSMPFTSVYHRVARMEERSRELAFLVPAVSKLGMVRVAVLAAASPGYEDEVTRALKAPNLWRTIGFCEGNFTHLSIQLVPVKVLKEFRSYIQQLVDRGLVTNFNILYTADYVPNFPDFDYYTPDEYRWRFDWEGWLASLGEERPSATLDDPESYRVLADKKDLQIIEELEKDGRNSFVNIARIVGMTPQGVKYHYDEKLVPSGIAKHFQIRVLPFPVEVAAYHEIMLEFHSKKDLDKFFALVPKLFFVVGVAKILRRNAVMVQTWMLDSMVPKMFSFFSQMARAGFLKSYSAVRIDYASRHTQTISSELFDDEKGWIVDFEKCTNELAKIEKVKTSS